MTCGNSRFSRSAPPILPFLVPPLFGSSLLLSTNHVRACMCVRVWCVRARARMSRQVGLTLSFCTHSVTHTRARLCVHVRCADMHRHCTDMCMNMHRQPSRRVDATVWICGLAIFHRPRVTDAVRHVYNMCVQPTSAQGAQLRWTQIQARPDIPQYSA